MAGTEVIPGGTPAPYGRACVNCARAKCRCIYRVAAAGCERCHRLKKHCEPSVTVRKRRRAESRTAQLEEKLEDLVSLLRNQGAVVNLPAAAGTTPVPTAAHGRPAPDPWVNTPAPSHGSQSDTPAAGISDARSDPNPGARAPMDPQTTADVSNSAFHPRLFNEPLPVPVPMASMMQYPWMPTPRQAEERLRLFCEQCLRCSPCIYIPPGTTSEKLRAEKPFSWFTIMMIACQTSSLQFAMGGAWQKIISQKIIIEHEKDIDLLQGMVIFLTWSHYHKKDKPYMAIFTQLALSHVYDLFLNKLPADPLTFACFKYGAVFTQYHVPRSRTMEDRRTVLACWFITSHIAFTLKKMDGLRWTPHLNDCLDYLDEHPEYPGDRLLAAQVRIQLLVEQTGSDGQSAPLPPYIELSALCSPVEALKKRLPPELETNEMLRTQLVYSELVTLESSLVRIPYTPEKPDLRRYDILSQLADATKRFFAAFQPVFESHYAALSFASWCQMAHSLMTLAKLSTLDEPAWDRAALRRDIDLLQTCDQIIRSMEQAGAQRRAEASALTAAQRQFATNTDIFSVCSRMISSMKNSWAAELAAMQQGAGGTQDQAARAAENGFADPAAAAGGWAVPTSFLDDAWLTDLMSVSWE